MNLDRKETEDEDKYPKSELKKLFDIFDEVLYF